MGLDRLEELLGRVKAEKAVYLLRSYVLADQGVSTWRSGSVCAALSRAVDELERAVEILSEEEQ